MAVAGINGNYEHREQRFSNGNVDFRNGGAVV